MPDANQHFKKELMALEINKHEIRSPDDVDFEFIEHLLEAQKSTCSALLSSQVQLDSNFVNLRQTVVSLRKTQNSRQYSNGLPIPHYTSYGLKTQQGQIVYQLNDLDSLFLNLVLQHSQNNT